MSQPIQTVLVTGATGFIGAHVVDHLLSRGLKVRGATRTIAKGSAMIEARPHLASTLEIVEIDDFANPGRLDDAVKGVDAVIHVASSLTYNKKQRKRANNPINNRLITSSFASVMNANRKEPSYFIYTEDDWNPITYEEAAASTTPAYIAYRGAKKFAEKAAWDFVRDRNPGFDLVTICPSMTFGPVAHPISSPRELNETNAMLWKAHVEALLRPEAGGRRFLPWGSERFSYDLAARIMEENFEWARGRVKREEQHLDMFYGVDGETAANVLGLEYTKFRDTIVDFVDHMSRLQEYDTLNYDLISDFPFLVAS
ncbi:3-beta hydroxysteroid dehydrogenase/isomerase family protein [Xylariaceae sp. FL1272]|nr:3-beta hydroxysteroid dehydrogenase/isomerase family protein [Xylariaceae sp. FL1272]